MTNERSSKIHHPALPGLDFSFLGPEQAKKASEPKRAHSDSEPSSKYLVKSKERASAKHLRDTRAAAAAAAEEEEEEDMKDDDNNIMEERPRHVKRPLSISTDSDTESDTYPEIRYTSIKLNLSAASAMAASAAAEAQTRRNSKPTHGVLKRPTDLPKKAKNVKWANDVPRTAELLARQAPAVKKTREEVEQEEQEEKERKERKKREKEEKKRVAVARRNKQGSVRVTRAAAAKARAEVEAEKTLEKRETRAVAKKRSQEKKRMRLE